MDLRTAAETYDGIAKNEAVRNSATADAQYYMGWTYKFNGEKADWAYYEEMIEKENLDAVHLCLPHYLHYPVTKEVALLGVNVLLEKPLCRIADISVMERNFR